MKEIITSYYKNNAKKLHEVVDRILLRFGGLSDKDVDDFYSLANEVFVNAIKKYDEVQSFDVFLYSCLSNKIKTEITRRNRYKRRADRLSVPIDQPVGDDEHCTLADMIPSDINIEKEVLEKNMDFMDQKIQDYLGSLSKIQRRIIEMKMQDIETNSIKKQLNLTDKQYQLYMRQAVQYEHIRLLYI
ncbi:MAG: hypothetical protein HFG34_04250 [Eubacterium sp.]|nr:hypothetical protein [Eubacterium sp.]